MLAGILLFAALGAEPTLQLQTPELRLALLNEVHPSVSDWPVEGEPSGANRYRRKEKLNLIPPLAVLSGGAFILGIGVLGAVLASEASCNSYSEGGCNLGTALSFGAAGFIGGVVFLIGLTWLLVDVVINASRPDIEPPPDPQGPKSDAPRVSRTQGPGLVLARF